MVQNRNLKCDRKPGIIKEPDSVSSHSDGNPAAYRAATPGPEAFCGESPSRRYPVDFRYPSILSRWLPSQHVPAAHCQLSQDNSRNRHLWSDDPGPVHPGDHQKYSVCMGPAIVWEFLMESAAVVTSASGSGILASFRPPDAADLDIELDRKAALTDRAVDYGAAALTKISFS